MVARILSLRHPVLGVIDVDSPTTKASKNLKEGILERLAIATSLELAAPELCGYTMIDPLKRYLAYEKWYLAGELDPRFKDMTTWQNYSILRSLSRSSAPIV